MQSPIPVGPVGPFTLVLETRLDRINTFWALNYAVMVEERHAFYKRLWPISHHDRSLYFLAYDNDILVGGTRLIRPLEGELFTQTVLAADADRPSAASLRALGAVGELTSLVAAKRVRGRFDVGACDALIQQTARAEGMTHLVLNAVIPWGTYKFYRLFGYQPYAAPQLESSLRRFQEDRLPNVVPMVQALVKGGPLPAPRPDVSDERVERLAAEYLQSSREAQDAVRK